MRTLCLLTLTGFLLSCGSVFAADEIAAPVTPPEAAADSLTFLPAPVPSVKADGGPVLQSLSVRLNVQRRNGVTMDVVPDFHFIAPGGNAIVLHRELVATSGAISAANVRDESIRIPAEAQKKGAVVSGGWRCGNQQYYVTMRATVMDADGRRSNPVQFTIHCNGG